MCVCNIWNCSYLYVYNLLSSPKASEFLSWGTGLDYLHEKNLELLDKANRLRLDFSRLLPMEGDLRDHCYTLGWEQPVQEGILASFFPRVPTGLGWWVNGVIIWAVPRKPESASKVNFPCASVKNPPLLLGHKKSRRGVMRKHPLPSITQIATSVPFTSGQI